MKTLYVTALGYPDEGAVASWLEENAAFGE